MIVFLVLCYVVVSFGCRQTIDKHTVIPNTPVMAANVISCPQDGPLVTNPSGSFRGSWMETRRGRRFEAYRGIRYAEPPIGNLRFQPPKPILHYDGEVDATKDGPAAPQPAPAGYYIDEDCLIINVYTPSHDSKDPLPVIFFIHAGGYYSMSGRSDLAGPHYLLDRDIVLVTINYRIGSLGFLSTGDALAPGNNGFKDQVVALRWVQRNIRSFGGDPDLVTLAGCSAGSSSVLLHMVSPMSAGLFHRGISISGSPITKVPLAQDMLDLAQKQARILNCPTNSSEAIIECLKTKSGKEIGESLNSFYDFGYDPLLIWSPIVEPDFGQERFLTMEPMEAIRTGKMHAVPFIVSRTTDEFFWKAFTILNNETLLNTMNNEWERIAPISFALPPENSEETVDRLRQEYFKGKKLVNDETTARALGNLYGDTLIGFPVHRMANLMCRHSPHKVYYYEFAYIGDHSHYEDPVTKKPSAAAHHDDLIYLFTLSYRYPTIEVSNSSDSQMVDKMTAIWYNFAKYGDPNPRDSEFPEISSLQWPPMTPTDRQYLRVGDQFSVHENLFEDRMKIWEELYSVLY
ncbi:carboxylic ester hydrolase-like [Achroia grisella]|uniref:carboxylic ester hydrolase-like n=1 Tax=Achroia grisella TaxID=688607 RepID=UPI0027D27777|nr:carboxylic ester hydrolase-like [Achroia grisella]